MASIYARLTDREAQLAEDMTRILDWLSRVIQGLDTGNLPYAEEKAAALIDRIERLDMHLQAAIRQAGREATVRPDMMRAAITEFASHYAAGRALYPLPPDSPIPRRDEVRVSPDGRKLAWYKPDSGDQDGRRWLVIDEDPAVVDVYADWHGHEYVAGWTTLSDPST